MTAERGIGWARGIGFVLGVSLAVTAVLGWRLPRGTGRLGADVAIAFLQTGELQLAETTPLITASGLRPGASATGTVDVRNSSGSRLSVSVTAEPSITDLDRLLWIDITAAGERLFRGPLGELRDGAGRRFTISPLQTRTLDVRAWLPATVTDGFEGRIDQVNLTFQPRVAAP
jgi:hypothetical protein